MPLPPRAQRAAVLVHGQVVEVEDARVAAVAAAGVEVGLRRGQRHGIGVVGHERIFSAAMMGAMYAIKAAIPDPQAVRFEFPAQKTMYGGKRIAVGDVVYLFASENEGGAGLVARGVVTAAAVTPRQPVVERQTPRVSITVERTALAKRRLGRAELKPFADWDDGRPETELNFKCYRQATNKIVGLSAEAAAFLDSFF